MNRHLVFRRRPTIETTRKIIFANGFAGNGPYVPDVLSRNLPKELHSHTSERIDFEALRGKSVAVLGSAASAFDAAAVALENGAREVRLFARRETLAALPVIRLRLYPGAYDNYGSLPDAIRWQQAVRFRRVGSTPPADAISRATRFPDFHLHLGAPWLAANPHGRRLLSTTPQGQIAFDFVIACTGYGVDIAARRELSGLAHEILLWRDRFTPTEDERDDILGAYPYLGAGHEYLEKVPGRAPYLKDIHVFNPAAFVSFGLPVGDIPIFKRDIPSVVARISRDLFLADISAHQERINGPVAEDFDTALYAPAVRQSPHCAVAE